MHAYRQGKLDLGPGTQTPARALTMNEELIERYESLLRSVGRDGIEDLIAFIKRGGKSMAEKLAAEIMDAYNNQGGAFKRKEDMHRMAEANRAFAHFRF